MNKPIRLYYILFAVYAILIGIYLWYAASNTVPDVYKGTPADPATFMTTEQLSASETYSAQRNWLFFIAYPWEWGIYIVLLFGGFAKRWEQKLERTGMPFALRLVSLAFLVSAVAFLVQLPLRFVGYTLSRSHHISTQPFTGWLHDKLVAFGVNTLITLAVAVVAFWIIRRGGRWWLKLWLLSVPFTLFLMYIQPVVIDPLYNEFSRLSDSALEQKIERLAADAGVPTQRVFQVDMSTKTNALNAYVDGIGPSLRIVLWDTTLKRMDDDEVLLIVAHEIGHYVMHHLEWSVLGAIGSSLALLLVGSILLRFLIRRWGDRWGIREPGQAAAFPLILLLLSVLSFVSLPVSNAVSRQAESSADRYAEKLIGSSHSAVSMQQKLALATLDEVDPSPLVRLFRSTHPSSLERIADAQAFENRSR
ncbi:M48 family metallopeptidase [Paenibacillus ginsengarvi]|uniref:M48 family peptidase n=1 Tax=Paenibacillus ginsengarvi TaxID=400777 RepID=A0A3B0CHS7_9BACL|nr:M48 family metallopeptidase [Paenibacillus ginsengarvi]RKN85265.1 M48 family peptidase [Paenibacillus ginsengarvi]